MIFCDFIESDYVFVIWFVGVVVGDYQVAYGIVGWDVVQDLLCFDVLFYNFRRDEVSGVGVIFVIKFGV